MDFVFENMGTNTFLVYEITEKDELDAMSLGMLTNNHIPGFALASFTQMDMTKYIKYNVSAKVSVKQLFSGPVNKKRLLGVFTGVVDAMLSAEDYMLDPASILLDTDYIFADVTTCETELICLPVMNLQHENQDLAMFFKNILFTTQFDQTENCDHVAQLINYLNTNTVLVLSDFKELLRTISGAQPQAKAAPVAQKSAPVQQAAQPAVAPAPTPVAPVQNAVKPQASPAVPNNAPVQAPVQKRAPAPATNVPPVNKAPAPSAPQQKVETSNEKPMSWIYLMQHYNKENAAIYKAQQDAKKTKGAAPAAPAQAKPVPQKAAPATNAGFAIPGQAAPGFAVPGQAKPVVQPAPRPVAQPAAQPAPQPVAQPAPRPVAQPAAQPAPQPVAQPAPQPVVQPAQASMPLNFGETTVLSAGIGETTVLSGAMEPAKNEPHLIRTKNNEKIPLNKPVFRIGKERSYVDYFIGDNTAVSRSHANIIDHNGEFFVVDTNSTNHTYVNGGMIQSGVETKLSHGTKIRLANEDFEFKLY